MAAFLLWNVQKKNRDALVQGLVREHRIDVVLLVEYWPSKTLSNLSNLLLQDGLARRATVERFGVFGPIGDALTAVPTPLRGRAELLDWTPALGAATGRFVLVHGHDRQHNDDGTRRVFFRRVANLVRHRETGTHQRSIVVGDFNAHPFESAVVSSDGLHAVGVRQADGRTDRRVRPAGRREDFFYNPMWRLYGARPTSEAGAATHYWQNRQPSELFWHMLDQVVIRPGECPHFPEGQLRILTRVGTVELLAPDGTPDQSTGTDHLPLIFHWNL